MHVSLNWLKTHIDLDGKTTEEISDLLTFSGIEVEGIEERGGVHEKVVVAKIVSAEKHPDADKLKICQVDDGSGTLRQIVCGAQNYEVGDHVPCALPGAELPGDFKIKEGKLRGIDSLGMLCGADEIGASSSDDGLWILPRDLAPGTPVAPLVPTDTLFELEITPNRPDSLSHRGVARELAVLTDTPLKKVASGNPLSPSNPSEITISAPKACPLYTARKITGIKVAPSPEWLQERLTSIGLRPINNIVDITNFVLHEFGHPLHAFDTQKLTGSLTIRFATEGEKFTALDESEHTLKAQDLVIADQAAPQCLAGIMGGAHSGVTDTTTEILLEAAYFTPSGIRRTSRRLALSSDSSYRFERGTDPTAAPRASALATQLILQLAGGTAEDTLPTTGTAPDLTTTIPLDPAHVARLLGTEIPEPEIDRILTTLGFTKTTEGWKTPTFRLDVSRPVDLIEEISRVYGLDKIPSKLRSIPAAPSPADHTYDATLEIKRTLTARGFFECQNIKLTGPADLPHAIILQHKAEAIPLKNPLSDDLTHLRPSLLPGLLTTAARNVRQGAKSLRLFEAGTIFASGGRSEETAHLALLIAGDSSPTSWTAKPTTLGLPDLIGHLQAIAPRANIAIKPDRNAPESDTYILGASISVNRKTIGKLLQLHPAHARELDLPANTPLLAAEINLPDFIAATGNNVQFAELPKFPAITRDVALELPAETPASKIDQTLAKANEALLVGHTLFDVFPLPENRKSLAYTLTYRNPAKTLKTEEADKVHARIIALLQKTGATTR